MLLSAASLLMRNACEDYVGPAGAPCPKGDQSKFSAPGLAGPQGTRCEQRPRGPPGENASPLSSSTILGKWTISGTVVGVKIREYVKQYLLDEGADPDVADVAVDILIAGLNDQLSRSLDSSEGSTVVRMDADGVKVDR